jgi:membrane protease YdiL (CAAX protease family)
MSREEQKKEYGLNEKVSTAILFFLLLVRLADQYLAVWIFGTNTPDWFGHWYAGIAYILTATLVWLNRHRLAALNIDRPFMVVLILSGAVSMFYLTPAIGTLVGLTTGFFFWAYHSGYFVFKNPVPYSMGTKLMILLIILLALAPVPLFRPIVKTSLNFQTFIETFLGILIAELVGIVFEEVIFRGALWAYLRGLGFSDRAAFSVQAVLFWISHHRFLLLKNPYSFWVSLPIQAVLLGLMVWRSKSLTPSTISHFLFNFISQLLLRTF